MCQGVRACLAKRSPGSLTRARGCWEMGTAGNEHAAEIWRPCDCAMRCSGHAGRVSTGSSRGRGAMAARAATVAAATRAGRALRVERAGGRGHGPVRARRASAAASMPQNRAKYARHRRVLRRAAAAYGVVYLAFYSARDVQTLTNQRGAQRHEMVHRWGSDPEHCTIVSSCVPRPVEIAISRPRLTFVPRVLFTGTLHFMGAALRGGAVDRT